MKNQIIHISIAKTDFNCPVCNKQYEEKDYYRQLYNSKKHFIYKTCKGCNNKLGISSNIIGNVVVWEKSKEKNYERILSSNK